jgi:hypothetical protein
MKKNRFRNVSEVSSKLKLPYACSVEQLRQSIDKRIGKKGAFARVKVVEFLKRRWGVDADCLNIDLSGIWLPRQIARADGEAFLTAAIAKASGVPAGVLELTLDTYVESAYKRSFTSQYVLSEDKSTITIQECPRIEWGTSLDEISFDESTRLIDVLRSSLSDTLGMMDIVDISPIYSMILQMNIDNCGETISGVMVKIDGALTQLYWDNEKQCYIGSAKTGKKIQFSKDEVKFFASKGSARPDAKWNYENFYLFLPGILCPKMAFVVNPFEFDDLKLLAPTFSLIEKTQSMFSLPPLIIPILPFSQLDLEVINRAKSKVGKYPEYVIYLLEKESLRFFSNCSENSFLGISFEVGQKLAEIALRGEIKRICNQRRGLST